NRRRTCKKCRLLRCCLDLECACGSAEIRGSIEWRQTKVVGANRRESALLAPGPFIGEIEECLTFLDWAAERRAGLHSRVGRIGNRAEGVHGLKIAISQVTEKGAVKIVRARASDDVHYPARRAPVLCRITVGDDLKFLNRFLRYG